MKKLISFILSIAFITIPLSMWAQQSVKTEVIEKDSVVIVVATQVDSAVISSDKLIQELAKIKQEIQKREAEIKAFQNQEIEYNRLLGQIVQSERNIKARRKEKADKK